MCNKNRDKHNGGRNMDKKLFNKGEDHRHFSLRKLTIGVASVLLGTTFMVFGSQSVHADDLNANNAVAAIGSLFGLASQKKNY